MLCSNSECQNSITRGHRNRLIIVCVVVSIAAILALSLAVGLLFYARREKSELSDISELVKWRRQMVSYEELRLATGNFDEENVIGRGTFGTVFKGYLWDGVAVAVKVLDSRLTQCLKSFEAECAALRGVRHRNLVKLVTSCSSVDFRNREFVAVVYEFVENGNLEEWIQGRRRGGNSCGDGFDLVKRLSVAIDVASAVNYLHHECETPVVHCDLKPSNVVLDGEMTGKVGDFGLAKLLIEGSGDGEDATAFSSTTNSLRGSIGYIPPEYGAGQKPSTAGDVYSFGIMLLQLLTGKSPTDELFMGGLSLRNWVHMSFPGNIDQILDSELLMEETQGECLLTIIGVGLSCTNDSPNGRITIREALRKLKSVGETLLNPRRR